MRALVRKLLLKVHPDVVGSVSETYRAHNENALKTLLSHLEGPKERAQATTRVFFYLRDGGRTSTVTLDSFVSPHRAVEQLLGIASTTESDEKHEELKRSREDSSSTAVQQPWTKEEFEKVFRESMTAWWVHKDFLTNEVERLFKQNRVRFASDALDINSRPDDELDPRKAVDLMKETLEYHVEESTLETLHRPFAKELDFVIVGRNLPYTVRSDDGNTLYAPLDMFPEDLGREIDRLLDDRIEQAMERHLKEQGQREKKAGPARGDGR